MMYFAYKLNKQGDTPTWEEVTASGINQLDPSPDNEGQVADHSFIMYYQNGSESRNSTLANAWMTPAIESLNTKEMQSMNVAKGDTYYVPGNLEPGEAYYAGILQNEAAKNYGHANSMRYAPHMLSS